MPDMVNARYEFERGIAAATVALEHLHRCRRFMLAGVTDSMVALAEDDAAALVRRMEGLRERVAAEGREAA